MKKRNNPKKKPALTGKGGVSRRAMATHYFPSTNARSSVARFVRWLRDDPTLHKALLRAGYRPRIRTLTPRMMAEIRRLLGE